MAWGTPDKSCIAELVPSGYKIKHVPRCGRGGGIAVVYKTSLNIQLLTSTKDKVFTTFEHMECTVSIKNYSMRLAVVYRPPPTCKNGLKTSTFLESEWPSFLAKLVTSESNIIVVGDLNIHLDNLLNLDTVKFTSILESCGMRQHVTGATHVAGHTLDVVITRDTDTSVSHVEISDPGLPDNSGKTSRDHFAVVFKACAAKPAPIRKTVNLNSKLKIY